MAAPNLTSSTRSVRGRDQILKCAEETKRLLLAKGDALIKAAGKTREQVSGYRKITKKVNDAGEIMDHIQGANPPLSEGEMVTRLAGCTAILLDQCTKEQHNGKWVVYDVAITTGVIKTTAYNERAESASNAAATAAASVLGIDVRGNVIGKQTSDGGFDGDPDGGQGSGHIRHDEQEVYWFTVTFVDINNAPQIERDRGEEIKVSEQQRTNQLALDTLMGAVAAGKAAPAAQTFTAEDVDKMVAAAVQKALANITTQQQKK
jgi:hypothetical protein